MPEQTLQQRRAALEATNLTPTERGAVIAGIPAPKAPSLAKPPASPLPAIIEPEPIPVDDITKPENVITFPTEPTIEPPTAESIFEEVFPQEQTETEQTQTEIQKRILDATKTLGGRETEAIKLEEEVGLPDITKELTELSGQINDLRLQSLDLQNQRNLIPDRIEDQFAGRGATRAGVAPLIAGELRKNALQQSSIASQALTLQSQAFILQGQYDIARQKVDRAIDLKYTPIENELKFLLTAMDINKDILEREDKERANRLTVMLQDRQEQINQLKQEESEKFDIAKQLQENGASPDLVKRALLAGSKEEALGVASTFQSVKDRLLTIAEAQKLGVPFGTTESEAFGIVPRTENGIEPLQKFRAERDLSKDFRQATSEAEDAARQLRQMEAGFAQAQKNLEEGGSINAASQAVLVTFQKVLDPTSVVRESEYARSGSGLSLKGQILGKVEKLQRGGAGVTVADLEDFVELGRNFMKGYQEASLGNARVIENQAQSLGLEVENIFPPSALKLLREGIPEDITDSTNKTGDEIITSDEEAIFDEVIGTLSKGNYLGNLWGALFGR